MTLTCPACGKVALAETAAACARCGCDLSRLARVLRSAAWHLQAAALCLREQDCQAALDHAETSWSLRHSPQAAQMAGLASAGLGDPSRLLQWRHAARQLANQVSPTD